jgi:hypothetical protein
MLILQVLLILIFIYLCFKDLLHFVLIGTLVFGVTFKVWFLSFVLKLENVGFKYYYDINEATWLSLALIFCFIFGILIHMLLISKKNLMNLDLPLFRLKSISVALILPILSVVALYGLYGHSWVQGQRIGGTATVGQFARILFGVLTYSGMVLAFKLQSFNIFSSQQLFFNILFILISYFLMLAGLRGWVLIMFCIILNKYFISHNITKKILIITMILALVLVKPLLSGASEIFHIGAKGDFVEVTATLLALSEQGLQVPILSIFSYLINFLPVGIRMDLGFETTTEYILNIIFAEFRTLNMGFNISALHVFLSLNVFFAFIVAPLLGFIYSILIFKIRSEGNILNSVIYLALALSAINFGSFKYLITFLLLNISVKTIKYIIDANGT